MTTRTSPWGRPVTWMALAVALSLAVLCLYMPYLFNALPHRYVYPYLRLYGLSYFAAAVLLALDLAQVGPSALFRWSGRLLFSATLLLWALAVAFRPGVISGQYAYSLIAAAVAATLIWPGLEERIFWATGGLLPLGIGTIMLLRPDLFSAVIYGPLRPSLPWLMAAGGVALLLMPVMKRRWAWWEALSFSLAAAALAGFALGWARAQNWLGALNYLTLSGVFGFWIARHRIPQAARPSPLRLRLSLLLLAVSVAPIFLFGAGAIMAIEMVEKRQVEATLGQIALEYDRQLSDGIRTSSLTMPDRTRKSVIPVADLPEEWQATLGVGAAHGYMENGQRYIAAYLRRSGSREAILVTRPWSEVFERSAAVGFVILLITLSMIVVTQSVAQVWSSRLVRRLSLLDEAAEAISEQDYSVRIDRGLTAGDEVARVAHSVNRMAAALEEYDAQSARYTREMQQRMEELDLERQRLSTVLEVLPAGVAIMDSRQNRVAVNPAFGRIWGLPTVSDVTTPLRGFRGWWRESGEPVADRDWALSRALRGEAALNQEIEIDALDGVRRTVLNSAVPVRDEMGEVRNAVVVLIDITPLVKMEEALRRSAERFAAQAAVLEQVAAGAPLEATLLDLTRLLERQAGVDACAIMLLDDTGREWLQVLSPAKAPEFWLESPPSDFLTRSFLGVAGAKAGEVRVLLSAGESGSEPLDGLVQMAAHITGIALTRHHRLESRTRKLVALIHHLTDGVIAIDASLSVLFMNRSAGTLLGIDVITAPTPLGSSGLPQNLQAILEQVNQPGTYTSQTRTLHWNETELEVEVLPVYGDLGRYGAVAVLRNVSERTRFTRLQQNFIANVSHELRGPLASVSATLEAIADGVIPEKERPRYMSAILEEMSRMRRLSYDVVDLTQLDSGLVVLNPQRFDLGQLFKSARDRYARRCEEAEVGLLIRSMPVTAWADRDRVDQVLVNLIENAIRFTPRGGRIDISAETVGDFVRVLVRDTGRGIPAEHLGQIWDRFYKVDRARTPSPTSGTGLGLTIVKQLVELMGGEVSAESVLGTGSTFSFSLPARPLPDEGHEGRAESAAMA